MMDPNIELVEAWVSSILDKRQALLSVEITSAKTAEFGCLVSVNYLSRELNLDLGLVRRNNYRELTSPLIQNMVNQKIIIPGAGPAANNLRKQLLEWFEGLSTSEKQKLPLFGNKINIKKVLVEDLKPIKAGLQHYKVVADTWSEIHEELLIMGVLESEYETVRERHSKKATLTKKTVLGKKYQALADQYIKTHKFALPSDETPCIQLEQLFAISASGVASPSGKSNFYTACEDLKKYYRSAGTVGLYQLKELLNEFTLTRYKEYLDKKLNAGKVSPSHASTLISAVRKTLKLATDIEELNYGGFHDVSGYDSRRVTDQNRPYSSFEREQIIKAINIAIEKVKNPKKAYVRTGLGKDPLNDDHSIKPGMGTLENARWLFENRLDCIPVHYPISDDKNNYQKKFLSIINNSDQGLIKTYEEWGVHSITDLSSLTPFLLKLSMLTGLNAESLFSLDIDDYLSSHPATGRPCLRYWKERSDGHKEYHLDLFHAELKWLTSKQSREIKLLFDDVINLTADFRDKIQEKYKKRLFIYQSSGVRRHREVLPLLEGNNKKAFRIYKALESFTKEYNLIDKSGNRMILNISRFRPTFVSEMIANGASIRDIQLMLGHSNIETTIGYLDSLDFNSFARKKINEKLIELQASTHTEVVQSTPRSKEKIGEKIIFKTPLSSCKNIFDPPDFIKNLKSYVKGKPCSQYNKCLSCENVIITSSNLPELFAMHRDYSLLLERNRIMDTPYGHVVKENLNLIEQIVNPETSDFSGEELIFAERVSQNIDTSILVDGVIA